MFINTLYKKNMKKSWENSMNEIEKVGNIDEESVSKDKAERRGDRDQPVRCWTIFFVSC